MGSHNARGRSASRWRWVYRVAVSICWIGGATATGSVLLAVLALFAGTDDPHGGGLMWAVAADLLPVGFGVFVVGMVLRAVASHRGSLDAPAG